MYVETRMDVLQTSEDYYVTPNLRDKWAVKTDHNRRALSSPDVFLLHSRGMVRILRLPVLLSGEGRPL